MPYPRPCLAFSARRLGVAYSARDGKGTSEVNRGADTKAWRIIVRTLVVKWNAKKRLADSCLLKLRGAKVSLHFWPLKKVAQRAVVLQCGVYLCSRTCCIRACLARCRRSAASATVATQTVATNPCSTAIRCR